MNLEFYTTGYYLYNAVSEFVLFLLGEVDGGVEHGADLLDVRDDVAAARPMNKA